MTDNNSKLINNMQIPMNISKTACFYDLNSLRAIFKTNINNK